ncbi:3-hydroxyacyl-CoA dehydrogenase/enoyl-CoA hydratase/3-hydroxybutyryl-CoA epimerase [Rhodothalassium salexigens DSM 2132]|uniref:enoyl-CoA hydratase n=1 Tax=Rhodothalassium salexigens DSM 2132 TaxID=1188247 RepID=A0A4R2PIQ0_RHOSA|nr:3-hydroxyacyl-CoA dehydrogenase NAD-binding domain-containing protein [Rhodothalassium salexigens]MBB4211430.1 3-hydroxyacyl-CoA dehydrogenase/enoyl-CoA hydratase/3-hydroxybutyryl-CoA epimerase [Rhodothalassium salexigens DSM 2132]MBK1637761.1 3-hydroxyacyl-CoA dehydrogenase [Rhodothalassium salexigens DSM 2132]TCP35350.1 3-hydroxyacyl-CoA dehydrogenase/enoyl-CoA hydratase/3-hydroxybutyryl-CoA epimerase [Rhodothalassium salexigens DSM 2132]
MTETIRFDVDADGIAVLTIDLPDQSMNVIDARLGDDLARAVDRVITDDAIVGAVIISGKKDFMAGADLRMLQDLSREAPSMRAGDVYERNVSLNLLLRKLETGGHDAKAMLKQGAKAKPFVAAVAGRALGGGFEIPLACHFRVCTPDAQFGLPEVMVGLLPGAGGTQRLPRLIGLQAALQYLTTGKTIKAQEAKGFGIVAEVVEPDQLLAKAKEIVKANPKVVAPWDQKGFKYPGGGGAMHPKAVETFIGANAMARGQSWGNYPAVDAILSCVYEGSIVPMDTAVRLESKYFTKLIQGPVAGNMIRTLFVNKQAAEKGMNRPAEVEKAPIQKLGMLGAGLMGAGIAYVSAKAGMEVVLLDREQAAADKGKAYSERLVEKDVKKRRTTQDKGQALLDRIHPTTDYNDLKGCDLIIEAVFENREIKAEVTKAAEAVVGPDTIFGTNTSTLPITSLAEAWSRPENFIGIHFFSPVEKMMLVEIIKGEKTGDKAIAKALDYTQAIRKTPIVVNDSRGFYTSRCVGVYIMEGFGMLEAGVAPALIENCGRQAGFPMGPLELGDEVAIDLSVKIMRQTMADLGDAYVASPGDAVAIRMVEDLGRFGAKNDKGFYDYQDHRKTGLWPGLADAFPVAGDQPSAEDVRHRLLFSQVVECARCFEEGILENPIDGDLGAIFGWGFPPFTGGPFSFLDTYGIARFVEDADALAARFGDRFTPPKLLRDMAAAGRTFYGDMEQRAAA